MLIAKGSILFVDMAGGVGREQASAPGSPRPCIVIQVFPALRLFWGIPLTSKPVDSNPKLAPYCIRLSSTTTHRAPISIALCHQVRVLSVDRVISDPNKAVTASEYIQLREMIRTIAKS